MTTLRDLKEKNDTDMNKLKENLDFKMQDLGAEIDRFLKAETREC